MLRFEVKRKKKRDISDDLRLVENDEMSFSNVKLIKESDNGNQLFDHLMLSSHVHTDSMLGDLYDLYRLNYNQILVSIDHNQAFSWKTWKKINHQYLFK